LKGNEISKTDYYSLSTTTARIRTPYNNILNFATAHELLVDRLSIEISKNKKRVVELTLGDKVGFVKPSSDLVCDTIVRGLLPKKFGGLESANVYVLVSDNRLDFYKIVEIAHKKYNMNLDIVLNQTLVKRIFTIHQLAHYLIFDLEKDIKKYKSKLVIITGDFFLNDSYIEKEDKDWLYYQMIEAVKKVTDSIIVVFSPINLLNLQNISAK
jgi:Rad51